MRIRGAVSAVVGALLAVVAAAASALPVTEIGDAGQTIASAQSAATQNMPFLTLVTWNLHFAAFLPDLDDLTTSRCSRITQSGTEEPRPHNLVLDCQDRPVAPFPEWNARLLKENFDSLLAGAPNWSVLVAGPPIP